MSFRTSPRLALTACTGIALAACAGNVASSGSASAPAAPAASMAAALPAGVTAAMVTVGDSIFHQGSCKNCHGVDAKGGLKGPDLTDTEWLQITGTYAEIVQTVTDGVPREKMKTKAQFAMRARGGSNLTDDQIKAVAAYVYTLSHH